MARIARGRKIRSRGQAQEIATHGRFDGLSLPAQMGTVISVGRLLLHRLLRGAPITGGRIT
jgi:hypothetical protein